MAPHKFPIPNIAPAGTKLWLLHVGNITADAGFMIAGQQANTSTTSNPNPQHERRAMIMMCVLIEHPTFGLILYETGPGKNYPEVWGPQLSDVFARVNYAPEQELEAQIATTGHSIKDVKAVVMGHLHLDHAGGLEHFKGTDVPIYVHEEELKHAFYSVATKTDIGAYISSYLNFEVNWTTFHGESWNLTPGLTLLLARGHTPGLCMLQINLANSGTWLFTTDQYHVKENYLNSTPQGWFNRDHAQWVRSHHMVQSLQAMTNAEIVYGHDKETFEGYKHAPEFYD